MATWTPLEVLEVDHLAYFRTAIYPAEQQLFSPDLETV